MSSAYVLKAFKNTDAEVFLPSIFLRLVNTGLGSVRSLRNFWRIDLVAGRHASLVCQSKKKWPTDGKSGITICWKKDGGLKIHIFIIDCRSPPIRSTACPSLISSDAACPSLAWNRSFTPPWLRDFHSDSLPTLSAYKPFVDQEISQVLSKCVSLHCNGTNVQAFLLVIFPRT